MSSEYVHAIGCNRELDWEGKHYGPCAVIGDGLLADLQLPANEPSAPEHDPVNHPTHYRSDATCSSCGNGIECIDVVRHLPFDRGNAIKYLWRSGRKGATVEDLKKAIWYIEDEIATLEGRKNPNVHALAKEPPRCACGKYQLLPESQVKGLHINGEVHMHAECKNGAIILG